MKKRRCISKARRRVPPETMQANESLATAIIVDMMQNPTVKANRSTKKRFAQVSPNKMKSIAKQVH
jgi:hypothetical protein